MSKGYDFLGDRIKKLRIYRGHSQTELGKALGLPKQAVSVIEKDGRKVSVAELEKIAEFLDTPTEFILKDGWVDKYVNNKYEVRNKWKLDIPPEIDNYVSDFEENYGHFIEEGIISKKIYIEELQNSIKAIQFLLKEIKEKKL